MGTDKVLVLRKVHEMLLVHVPGECKGIREAPNPDVRSQTYIPQTEQTLGFRTQYRINIKLSI
jgi:hypothetical protein